jgi:hypothetical protein
MYRILYGILWGLDVVYSTVHEQPIIVSEYVRVGSDKS